MSKMRIFHIITGLRIGGAETALFNLLSVLTQQDRTVHAVAYFYAGPYCRQVASLNNVTLHHIQGALHYADPLAYRRLYLSVKKFCPDIIHTSLWAANILGRLIGKQLNIPVVSDLHGNCSIEGWFRNTLDRITAPLSDQVISVALGVQQSYQERIIKKSFLQKFYTALPAFSVINNGVSVKNLQQAAQRRSIDFENYNIKKNDFIIGSVGRLEKVKSFDILIKAFAVFLEKKRAQSEKTSCYKLCIVGGGSQRKILELLACDLGLHDNMIFPGTSLVVAEWYSIFDCFVLSSQSEGLSIALLEAMSFGVPVICTSTDDTHEVLVHGINGFIVSLRNPVNQIAHYIDVISQNVELKNKIKRNNATLVQQKYDIAKVAEKYLTIYKTVIHG